MINEKDILSDEELLKITGGETFASDISIISNPPIIRPLYGIEPIYDIKPLYGIQPMYGIKPLYGIRPLNT